VSARAVMTALIETGLTDIDLTANDVADIQP
jgi:hypothetical protein